MYIRLIISYVLLFTAGLALGQLRSGAAQQTIADLESTPTLRLVEELRIGSANDPSVGFAQIGAVDVDHEGLLYVFEGQDRQIRVYSDRGQLLRTIGRAGNGPGEFAGSIWFGVKGDTVWAIEGAGVLAQSNIALFDRRSGVLLRSVRSEVAQVPGRGRSSLVFSPRAMRSDGMFISLDYISASMRGATATGIGPEDTLRLPRIAFGTDGKVRDTLSWYREPPSPPQPGSTSITSSTNIRHFVPRPPPERTISRLFPDGRFQVENRRPSTASPGTLRVTRENIRGAAVYSRSYRFSPVRYSSEILDTLAARSLRGGAALVRDGVVQMTTADTTAQTRAQVRAAMQFPDFQQPLQATFIGADASILLRREEVVGAQRWDLLDPQGNPRGKIQIPANVRPLWLSGDTMWAAIPDNDDVPFLVKYRIAR